MYMFSNYSVTIDCLFWPLWGAICLGLLGYRLGSYWSSRLAVICLFITAGLAIYNFIFIGFQYLKIVVPLYGIGVFYDVPDWWPLPVLTDVIKVKWSFLLHLFAITFILAMVFYCNYKSYNKIHGQYLLFGQPVSSGILARRSKTSKTRNYNCTKRSFTSFNNVKTLFLRALDQYPRFLVVASQNRFALITIVVAIVLTCVCTGIVLKFTDLALIQVVTLIVITVGIIFGIIWLVFYTDVKNKLTFNRNMFLVLSGFLISACFVCSNYFIDVWSVVWGGAAEAGGGVVDTSKSHRDESAPMEDKSISAVNPSMAEETKSNAIANGQDKKPFKGFMPLPEHRGDLMRSMENQALLNKILSQQDLKGFNEVHPTINGTAVPNVSMPIPEVSNVESGAHKRLDQYLAILYPDAPASAQVVNAPAAPLVANLDNNGGYWSPMVSPIGVNISSALDSQVLAAAPVLPEGGNIFAGVNTDNNVALRAPQASPQAVNTPVEGNLDNHGGYWSPVVSPKGVNAPTLVDSQVFGAAPVSPQGGNIFAAVNLDNNVLVRSSQAAPQAVNAPAAPLAANLNNNVVLHSPPVSPQESNAPSPERSSVASEAQPIDVPPRFGGGG